MNQSQIAAPSGTDLNLDTLLEVGSDSITTIVDSGVLFEGKLTVRDNKSVLISGAFKGTIESDGAVIVNAGAEIVGSIRARSVQVAGTVKRGAKDDVLDVAEVLVLAKGAKVFCDARYGNLKAEHGVVIAGSISPRDMPSEAPVESHGGTVVPMTGYAGSQ
ncbi:bactofilin family protein [Ramlibacter sp. AN1133]|uniref:bactofilin family protein n=1 Tax=Ramlibacter sp. AN1133 TaxID=3133429 RepID=UPI0030C162C4